MLRATLPVARGTARALRAGSRCPQPRSDVRRFSQSTVVAQASPSVVDLIVQEHNTVRDLYREYKRAGADEERKQQLAWWMIRTLAKHAVKEEIVLYPEIRTTLGKEDAQRLLDDHRELKRSLDTLDGMSIKDDGYDALVDKVYKEFDEHATAHEEKDELPKFARAVSGERLEQLGATFKNIDAAIPSRPHPLAPDVFPLNLAGSAVTPLDAARDLGRFGVNQEMPAIEQKANNKVSVNN